MGLRNIASRAFNRLVPPNYFHAAFVEKIEGLENKLLSLEDKLVGLGNKIEEIVEGAHGSRATYVGNGRVLVKMVVGGNSLAYFMEADDILLSPWAIVSGRYETELTNYFLRELRPNSHCLDIGSNFGYYTCLMARLCLDGQVIGIEPNHKLFEIGRDNICINNCIGHAEVIHAAAGSSQAELTLYRRVGRSGNTSLLKPTDKTIRYFGEPTPERFSVRGVRVDDLLPRMNRRVDFIKLDVEGAEPLVFEGARQTIAANPLLQVVMEWSPGQIRDAGFDVADFLASLSGLGFSVSDIRHDGIRPMSFDELQQVVYRPGILLGRQP